MKRFVAAFIPLLIFVEFLLSILFRKVNLDEGWYLWASKLVYQGQVLYRDFTYTQTPLLPYVYGLWQLIAGQGLLAGRVLTGIFGLLTAAIGALIVQRRLVQRRLVHRNMFRFSSKREDLAQSGITERGVREQAHNPVTSALLGYGLLFGTSIYAIVYLAYTATYGLACFLLTAALYFALGPPKSHAPENNIREEHARKVNSLVHDALAIGLLCLAVATRLSILPALPIIALYCIWQSQNRWRTVLVIALVIGFALAGIALFATVSGPQMGYDIFGFHTDRTPSMVRQFWRMVDTTQNTARAHGVLLVLILMGGGTVAIRAIRTKKPLTQAIGKVLKENDFEIALLVSSLGIFLLHLWPRTTDAYYNTLLFPVWLILASLALHQVSNLWQGQGRSQGSSQGSSHKGAAALDQKPSYLLGPSNGWAGRGAALVVGVAVLNLILQVDAVQRNDLLQVPPINQLQIVQDAATFLARTERSDNRLLTLNTHLALESGMNVPRGYDMSIFSYRPDWTTEQAQKFKVINNQMLVADLTAGVDAVAVTDFDLERFYGDRQLIFDTLNEHYRLSKTIPGFDPFYNNLYIYLPPQFSTLAPDNPLVVALENGITLLGYDIEKQRYRPGHKIYVGLYWRSEHVQERTYTVFMHLLDQAGNKVYGWDNPPCRTTCPTNSWAVGEILRDEYTLEVPDGAAPGIYRIRTGMYNSDTGDGIMTRTQGDFIQDGRLIILGEVVIGK